MSIETLFTVSNLLALLIVLAGAFIRGYSGFGSGLIMVPLLALIWGPIDAIIFTLSLGLLATAQMTLPATKIANWRDITPIIIAAVVVTPLGTVILVNLDGEVVGEQVGQGVDESDHERDQDHQIFPERVLVQHGVP